MRRHSPRHDAPDWFQPRAVATASACLLVMLGLGACEESNPPDRRISWVEPAYEAEVGQTLEAELQGNPPGISVNISTQNPMVATPGTIMLTLSEDNAEGRTPVFMDCVGPGTADVIATLQGDESNFTGPMISDTVVVTCREPGATSTSGTTGTTGDTETAGTTDEPTGTGGVPGCSTNPMTDGPIDVDGTVVDVTVSAGDCPLTMFCPISMTNNHSADVFATYAPFSPGDPIQLSPSSETIPAMTTSVREVVINDCTTPMSVTLNVQFFDDVNMMQWAVPIMVNTTVQ